MNLIKNNERLLEKLPDTRTDTDNSETIGLSSFNKDQKTN